MFVQKILSNKGKFVPPVAPIEILNDEVEAAKKERVNVLHLQNHSKMGQATCPYAG